MFKNKMNFLKLLLILYCSIFCFDFSIRENHSDITEVSYRNYDLDALPDTLIQCKNLEYLDLSGNPKLDYSTCLKVLSNFNSLKELRLGYNKLSFLPKEVLVLEKLKILDLTGNFLNGIDSSIEGLSSLEILSLGDNRKLDFDKTIINLARLKKLSTIDLSYIKIDSISKNICNVNSLENLYLGANGIEFLPNLSCLPSLKRLSLDANIIPIENIINTINGIEELEAISLDLMELHLLPCELQNIKYISLQKNMISKIPDCFCLSKKHEELNISSNNLDCIPNCLINKLSKGNRVPLCTE
jgi:Leucine-rich repeat (LRR) protein